MNGIGRIESAVPAQNRQRSSAVSLKGLRVLIAEDEPIIALDLASAFESAGAEAIVVHTLQNAIAVARVDALSAAVVDLRLKHDLSSPLCALLQLREIPFVIYTGYDDMGCRYNSLIMPKPTPAHLIVERLAILTQHRSEKATPLRSLQVSRHR